MDANRPLLMGSSPGDSGANNLGELGEAGGTLSVQQLRDCTPEQAFTLLRQRGTKTLGTLTVPVCSTQTPTVLCSAFAYTLTHSARTCDM